MKKSISNSVFYAYIFLIILMLYSCKTRRNSINKNNPSIKLSNKEIKDSILANQSSIQWLKARGNVSVLLPFNDDEQTIDINLRLKRQFNMVKFI